jgi:hypothetical protein
LHELNTVGNYLDYTIAYEKQFGEKAPEQLLQSVRSDQKTPLEKKVARLSDAKKDPSPLNPFQTGAEGIVTYQTVHALSKQSEKEAAYYLSRKNGAYTLGLSLCRIMEHDPVVGQGLVEEMAEGPQIAENALHYEPTPFEKAVKLCRRNTIRKVTAPYSLATTATCLLNPATALPGLIIGGAYHTVQCLLSYKREKQINKLLNRE